MKKINAMFHIDNDQLIKTSNHQPVPDDEPIFILRGRDKLAVHAITAYRNCCATYGTPGDRIDALDEVIESFEKFKLTHASKLPGSTHGK